MNDSFFGAIVGGLFTLVAVLITLRRNQRNFEINLREEREKAREEREFKAKHKALLSAVETVTRFLNYYLTLPDRELPKDGTNPNEVSEMAVSLNRLHFYCDMNTIKQSVAMSQILSKSYINVLKAKMPAMFIAEEIKVIDTQIADLGRQQIAANTKTISEFYQKRADLIKKKYHATEVCRDVIIKDLKDVYKALQDTLLMVRRELAFPIDEREYTAMLTQVNESTSTDMKNFLSEIRAEITKKLQ